MEEDGTMAPEENSPAKKCGAESSDPNRHSQPRLPGSVV